MSASAVLKRAIRSACCGTRHQQRRRRRPRGQCRGKRMGEKETWYSGEHKEGSVELSLCCAMSMCFFCIGYMLHVFEHVTVE